MITSPITRPITSRIASAIAGARVAAGRWYLHWGGVNEYAVHSAWAMSGFGDKIEFRFIADTPGTGDDYLFDSTSGENYLKITNTTAALSLGYMDIDGATQRTIAGPTIVAGTEYTGYVEFKADGVDLVVNGTTYDSANVPEIKDDFTHIAAETTPSAWFDGTIHYLRYVNATALQGVNAVQGNGVDLYGVIPEMTLTGDFEIEFWWRRQDGKLYTGLLGFGENNDNYIIVQDSDRAGAESMLTFRANDVSSNFTAAVADIAQGQDCHIKLSRLSGVLTLEVDGVAHGTTPTNSEAFTCTQIGEADVGFHGLYAGSYLYNLKITDKSGAEDVVYQYDLSGDDGDVIPNVDPVTGVLGDEVHDYGESAIAVGEGTHAFKDGSGVYRAARDGALVGQINLIPADEIEAGTYLLRFNAYEDSQEAGNWIDIREGGSPLIQRALTDGEAVEVVVDLGGTYNLVMFGGPTVGYSWRMDDFSCKPYPHGTWQNYDSGVDQVALPKLSRYYKIADGPNATHLADSWGADAIGAELFNVAESDWDRSKT